MRSGELLRTGAPLVAIRAITCGMESSPPSAGMGRARSDIDLTELVASVTIPRSFSEGSLARLTAALLNDGTAASQATEQAPLRRSASYELALNLQETL